MNDNYRMGTRLLLLILQVTQVISQQQQTNPFPVNMNSVPIHFYNFGPDSGDNVAPVNDDGSTGPISIAVAFPFYNNYIDHGTLYISTNGVVSFLRDVPQYVPEGFPLSGDRRMIAPYWSDVDTREHGGRIYYHEYRGSDRNTLEVRRKAKEEAVDAFPGLNYTPDWVMVVTWHRVTCFYQCTAENTFQLALSTDGERSYVSFHYGSMTWTKGNLPPGESLLNGEEYIARPAVVGFNAGDGINFEMLSDSLTENVRNVETATNIGLPGVRVYQINDANIQPPGCSNNFAGTLQVTPRFSSHLGGKHGKISGPCFKNADIIKCKFENITVDGRVIDQNTAECTAPFFGAKATVPVKVSIDGGQNFIYQGKFVYVEYDPTKEVDRVPGDGWLGNVLPPFIRWSANQLDATHVNISFVMFTLSADNTVVEQSEVLIQSNVPNSATNSQHGIVGFAIPDVLEETGSLPNPTHGAIRVGPATSSTGSDEYLWSDIHEPDWYLPRFFAHVASQNTVLLQGGGRRKRALPDTIQQAWNDIGHFFNNVGNNLNDIRDKVQERFTDIKEAFFSEKCDKWVADEQSNPADFSGLPPPPCTLNQAQNDPNFMADTACNMGSRCALHQPDAFHCVRSRRATANGAAQQACYSESGQLLQFDEGGGTVDRAGVVPWFSIGGVSIPTGSVLRHFWHDVRSYYYCCKYSNNCNKYSQKRPTQDCSNYVPPGSGTGFGDPHIFTLDGFEYTFNGLGEFVLLQALMHGLIVHARTTQAINSMGEKLSATEWSALAMKMTGTSTVQLQVNEITGLDVLIDGVSVLKEFDDVIDEIPFTGGGNVMKMNQSDNSTGFLVSFPSATFQIKAESTTRLSFLIQVVPELQNNTSGLLGVWNKDKTDDLLAANGTTLDPKSSQETIFHSFGETWRITENNSLFTYVLGPSYSDYNDRSFRPVFPREEDLKTPEAVVLCGTNKLCLFDFNTTNGDTKFAMATMKGADLFKEIIENTKPVVTCGFPVNQPNANVSGKGSLVGAFRDITCHEGFTLTAPSRIVCQGNGSWTVASAVCAATEESDSGNGGLLVLIITGAVSFVLVLSVLLAAVYVCCSTDKSPVNKPVVPPRDPPLAINTGMPTSNTGYIGPYVPGPFPE